MRRFSIPILGWVVGGLMIVGLLPFALTWYQIERSRDGIVGQTQQTHQLLARSTAERIGGRLAVLGNLLIAAGDTEALYLDPNAASAQLVMEQLFAAERGMLALGLLSYRDGTPIEVKVLSRKGEGLQPLDFAATEAAAEPLLRLVDGRRIVRVQAETTRPGLSLVALVDASDMDQLLVPRGVDEAELALLNSRGELLAGVGQGLALIPAEMRDAMLLPSVNSGNNSFQSGDVPVVYGFARVPENDWRVVSTQTARKAESAVAEMRSAAWRAFTGVSVVVALLSLAAWRFVVRPIRRLTAAGSAFGHNRVSGSEIAQLEATFERLEEALKERDEVSEIFVDRYQVIRRIGQGAMGTVYLGEDPKLKRKVALKTIRRDDKVSKRDQRDLAERLFAEGITSAKLTHPNVVTVYDVVGDKRGAFIAMEYVEGESLEVRIDRQLRIAPADVVAIARGVLKALKVAHANGVVHRDVKPGNILIDTDGTVKLTDFGIAAALAGEDHTVVMGTPGYLAPECYVSAHYDAATDLFALGVVIVECLTGQVVFPGRHTQQIIARTRNREVILPLDIQRTLPEPLRVLSQRLLAKEPQDRPASATEALEIIQTINANSGVTVAEVSPEKEIQSQRNSDARRRVSNAATTRAGTVDPSRER